MSRGDDRSKPSPGSNLLGDLESIRTLLDEDDQHAPAEEVQTPEPGTEAEDVPVLQDVVDGALEVDESPLTSRAELSGDGFPTLDDDTIQALMGDEWKDHAAEIIATAREAVARGKLQWSPEQTDELSRILKARLDGIVNAWLVKTLSENIDDLRRALLAAIDDEVSSRIQEINSEEPDGH